LRIWVFDGAGEGHQCLDAGSCPCVTFHILCASTISVRVLVACVWWSPHLATHPI
jgi:hypothetical protein